MGPSAGPAPEPGLPKVRTQGGATSGSGGRAEPDGAAGPPAAVIFQEISAGTPASPWRSLEVGRVRPGRIRAEPAAEIRELLRDDRFSAEAEDRGGVARDWKHFALTGATFSSARRPDKHGRPRALRTATRPEGDGGRDTEADNLVAERCVAIAEQQLEQGRFFSIKSPEGVEAEAAAAAEQPRTGHEPGSGPVRVRGPIQEANPGPDERRVAPGGDERAAVPRGAGAFAYGVGRASTQLPHGDRGMVHAGGSGVPFRAVRGLGRGLGRLARAAARQGRRPESGAHVRKEGEVPECPGSSRTRAGPPETDTSPSPRRRRGSRKMTGAWEACATPGGQLQSWAAGRRGERRPVRRWMKSWKRSRQS